MLCGMQLAKHLIQQETKFSMSKHFHCMPEIIYNINFNVKLQKMFCFNYFSLYKTFQLLLHYNVLPEREAKINPSWENFWLTGDIFLWKKKLIKQENATNTQNVRTLRMATKVHWFFMCPSISLGFKNVLSAQKLSVYVLELIYVSFQSTIVIMSCYIIEILPVWIGIQLHEEENKEKVFLSIA